ncbi:hypothetical protein PP502_gp54 [Gordonia phage Beenie]|uniref:Uncharacterized protein n=1 Tax=Gordonia phage Beenie TaxID=2079397 RepID=A0A2K9VH49_9CAUD|nr:hypothetical protein PP502_gp54 [Gordonia phage Beenie]AUV61619.1 hypothetical protein PBI_BEENIE_54 [Gordonia phage Beenie]
MTADPAVNAADKALDAVADDKRMFLDDWDVLTDTAIAAAREALTRIKGVIERADLAATGIVPPAEGITVRADYDAGYARAVKDLVGQLAPLIYPEDEL